MNNFQRDGAVSNADVGRKFEARTQRILASKGLVLDLNHKVPCGLPNNKPKPHAFDLGSDELRVIVECKSHTWTISGRIPNAKLKNMAEAMFYFHMAPSDYRKIFVAERSERARQKETLLVYFFRTQRHMIPSDVEVWELDCDSDDLWDIRKDVKI